MLQRAAGVARHHKIDNFAHRVSAQEPGYQHVRVGLVQLPGADCSDLTEKLPPRPESRRDANAAGESNRGRQHQSIVPSVATSATVRRSPMTA
jgi:hypothetical protein